MIFHLKTCGKNSHVCEHCGTLFRTLSSRLPILSAAFDLPQPLTLHPSRKNQATRFVMTVHTHCVPEDGSLIYRSKCSIALTEVRKSFDTLLFADPYYQVYEFCSRKHRLESVLQFPPISCDMWWVGRAWFRTGSSRKVCVIQSFCYMI